MSMVERRPSNSATHMENTAWTGSEEMTMRPGMPPLGPVIARDPYEMVYELQKEKVRLQSELDFAHSEIRELRNRLTLVEQERMAARGGKKEVGEVAGESNATTQKIQSRYWTPEEHQRFIEAIQKFGPKDVRSISNYVGTRNPTQVRTHAQKYFLRLQKEQGGKNTPRGGTPGQHEERMQRRRRCMSEGDLARLDRPRSPTSESSIQRSPLAAPPIQRYQDPDDEEETLQPMNGISLLSLVAAQTDK